MNWKLFKPGAAAVVAIGALTACSGADTVDAKLGAQEDPSGRTGAALESTPAGRPANQPKEFLPAGRSRKARPVEELTRRFAFDYPATLVGTLGKVTAYYDPSLGTPGQLIAQDLLNVSGHAYADMETFFGITGSPVNFVIVSLTGANDGMGGAYHWGCDFTSGGTFYLDAAFASMVTDPLNLELGLFVAELSEAFMGPQGAGWGCGESNGEGLSRYLAEHETPPHTLDAYATGPSWVGAGFPDWISSTEPTDRDAVSTGAAILYLYWMRSRGYGVSSIVQAGGGTLQANYRALTGATTAYADLTAALRGVTVSSDDPFVAPVTGGTAWIWSGVRLADPNYTYNSWGSVNSVTHLGTGHYRVSFGGVTRVGGNVQVSSYGWGPERCKVAWWSPEGSATVADVVCHGYDGTPADSLFVAVFQEQTSSTAGSQAGAYLWSDGEATPPSTYQWNANGSLGTVTPGPTGVYDVTFPGIHDSHGSPEVTAYGSDASYCKIGYWYTDGTNLIVRVNCFAALGAPQNSDFSINFGNGAISTGYPGASHWANQPLTASYTPSTYYQVNTTGGLNGAGRYTSGTGWYFADFPGLPATGPSPFGGSLRSTALATAYGSGTEYCKVGSWGGTRVNLACFAANGTAVNTYYVPAYMTNDFSFSD
jgi:hypothetical protein